MYKNIFANAAAIIIVALLDAVFISSLPFGLHRLHLLFLVIVFVLLFSNIRMAAWWALGGALILEMFSFGIFGTYLFISFFVLVIAYFLFEKVMTNRSIFAVMTIAGIVTVAADLLFLAFDYWANHLIAPFSNLVYSFLMSIVVNILASIIFFYIANLATRRLKPVFLPFIRRW